MKLAQDVELFSIGRIPAIGNLTTGGIIGLTESGGALCALLAEGDITKDAAVASDPGLIKRLESGHYLDDGTDVRTVVSRYKRAYLHVTQRCNLKCRFCYSDGPHRNTLDDPSLPELHSALDVLAELGVSRLTISGGEPFLRGDLAAIVQKAKDCGITNVEIITNGTVAVQKQLQMMGNNISTVYVSFDGCSENDRAWLRESQRFKTLVETLDQIEALNIRPGIIATIHRDNFPDIERYRRLADCHNADLKLSLLLTKGDYNEMFYLNEVELDDLGNMEAAQDTSVCLQCKRTCGAGVTTLSVDADGSVYPCHMLHLKEYCLGNAYRDSAQAIIASSTASLFRSLCAAQFPGCSDCSHRVICGGGCRARALYSNGSLSSKDPYCSLFSSYYSRITHNLEERYLDERK